MALSEGGRFIQWTQLSEYVIGRDSGEIRSRQTAFSDRPFKAVPTIHLLQRSYTGAARILSTPLALAMRSRPLRSCSRVTV